MLATFYLATAGIFLVLLATRPYLIVRPSFWVCLGLLVRVNAAAAFCGPGLDSDLQNAALLRWLTLLFPLGVLVWLLASRRLNALGARLYAACRAARKPTDSFGSAERSALVAFGAIACFIVLAYLATVPLSSTGLAAVLFDPENATQARENGLKLLSSPVLKYAYTFHVTVFAPLLVVLLSFWRPRRLLDVVVQVLAYLTLFFTVTLTGARAPAGVLLVVFALARLLRNGVFREAITVCAAVVGVLLIATVLSIFREGRGSELSASVVEEYLWDGILGRTFVSPYKTGVWTNRYAQEYGLRGVSNIRPLAILAGRPHENLPNLVALAYFRGAKPSSAATAAFLFDFQASFGLVPGWIVSLIALCSLDYLLLAFGRLKPFVMVLCLAPFLGALHFLVASGFTVCLLSHGILPIAGIGYFLGRMPRFRSHNLVLRRSGWPADPTAAVVLPVSLQP